MFYITITNPVTETTTKRDYKTEKGAERAYNKAIENPDNIVYMCRYATSCELWDTTVKTNA